ncbi:MAG: polyketide synthase dehydratase domain-containing protein [Acidobacteria bacterium]|nr:polyketide synthase dehydratase domain-containing protein [Acidobacteriota bacterium]
MSDPSNNRRDQSGVCGDVAIIGMACTYPRARNTVEFWQNIINGVDAITDVSPERWDSRVFYDPDPEREDRVYCKRGGWLGDSFAFNPLQYGMMPRAVEGAEPDQFLVLRTVYEAMEDAGYLERELDGRRATFILGRGNYLGAGLTGLLQRGIITEQTLEIIRRLHPEYTPEHLDGIKAELRAKLPGFGAETAPGLIPNIATGRAANRLDFRGANFTVDAACASSLIATELGVRGLIGGKDDLVLVGGIHIFSDVPFLQVFDAMKALSLTSTIRPFDQSRDGTLAGEGVGILVLKRLGEAERDRDRIYAVIKGVGSSSDGKAKSVTAPRVEGEELALRRAYEMSGVPPETVRLIEAHGTGTSVGDATEVEALHRVLGSREGGLPDCAIGSVKSMIGHTMPAAGAAALIKAALALHHRVLPPTLNCRQPIEPIKRESSRIYVNTETRPWISGRTDEPRRAGVNAFGFGGVNAHVVLEEYVSSQRRELIGAGMDERSTLIREWESELFVLEGDTREALAAIVARLRGYTSVAYGVAPRDLAFTLNTSLRGAAHRVSVVASSLPDLAEKLGHVVRRLQDSRCQQIKDTQGIYYFGESPLRSGKIALLFPGEGSQYVNMLADLCIHFPQVRKCFDAADCAIANSNRYPPSADIFPPPALSDTEARAAEARLWKIERATEAVLTADWAIYTLLGQLGVKADMIAGHSAGEWMEMVASGILDIDEFISSMDGLDRMYRKLAADTTIPEMTMLAVGAGREKVERLLAEIDCPVYVANDNCPHQVVVVVEPEKADAITNRLQSSGIFVERLPYDRGYHTEVFTYICEPLREYFRSLTMRRPHTAVYSCTTAKLFPTEPIEILDLVSNTFARPLLFRETIEAMYEDGARVFIEAGPRGNLTAFVDDILRGRPHLAIPVDQYRKPGITTLNRALGMLAALNVPLDLNPLYTRRSPRLLTLDAVADQPEDEDAEPGTLQVSICYPKLQTAAPPRSAPSIEAAEDSLASVVAKPKEFITSTESNAELESPLPLDQPPDGQAYEVAGEVAGQTTIVEHRASAPNGVMKSTKTLSSFPTQVMDGHFRLMEEFLQTQEEVMQAYLRGAANSRIGRSDASSISEQANGREVGDARTHPIRPDDLVAENGAGKNQVRPEIYQQTLAAAVSLGSQTAVKESSPSEQTLDNEGVTELVEPAKNEVTLKSSPQKIHLQDVLVQIVSEKTGYPSEILDLDLDMEADLGIDSIKRIEILGALQQADHSQSWFDDAGMEQVAKLKTLRQIVSFLGNAGNRTTANDAAPTNGSVPSMVSALTFSGSVLSFVPGNEVVVRYPIDLDEDLFLIDHCFDGPVSEWDRERGGLSFVPLTVSLELMAEVAALLMPGLKVVGAKEVRAHKWIEVEKAGPQVILAIAAGRTSSTEVRVTVRHHQVERPAGPGASEPLAEAIVKFAKDFPSAPPVEELELKNDRPPACTAEEMYGQRRMFHGPRFRGVVSLDRVGEDGLLARLEVLPTHDLFKSNHSPVFNIDPFLLDAAGQLIGYWPIECLSEGFVLFPIRVAELTLYRENLGPGQRAICQVRIRDVAHRQLRADMDIIGPSGTLWMRVTGWEDWRFYWTENFYDFWRFPNKGFVSEAVEIPKPAELPGIECRQVRPFGEMGKSMWENLWAHLTLSRRELTEYRAMGDPRMRAGWLFGRVAAKDAVRAWVKRQHKRDLYPADVEIIPDEHGKPKVSGRWSSELGAVPQVSIAHKGTLAVAAAAEHEVGIDVETIEERDAGFEALAFGEGERHILGELNNLDHAEWVTRAWCAKEAAGKAMGRGLNGNPRSMSIQSVDPDSGEIVVASEEVVQSRGGSEFVVQSFRDGGFVITLAVRKRNEYATA